MKNENQIDAAGTKFNPQIHQIRFGKPLIRRKDGCFVLKKGIKKAAILHETAQNGTETHVPETPESAQSAEIFVDAILNAGESTPTVPAPEAAPAAAAPETSFVPDDLTFPEENHDFDNDGFFKSTPQPEPEKPKNSAETANISAFSIVEITEQTASVLLGEEMKMQPEEKKRLIQAWENYLATTQGFELPPWAALLGLNALYLGTRLMLPNVQEKLINIWRNLNGQPPIKRAEAQSVVQ